VTETRSNIITMMLVVALAASTFAAGLGVGRYLLPAAWSPLSSSDSAEQAAQFRLFEEAWRLVKRQFFTEEPLDGTRMIYGAIRGMLASLGDRHSVFLEPSQADMFRQDLEGEFSGIGATVNSTDDGLVQIVKPLPGTPAERAGLQPGDVILAVDGRDLAGLDLNQAVLLIRGPTNSTVRLLIQRLDVPAFEVSLVRSTISVATTESRMLDGQLGYLALYEFNARAPKEVVAAIKQLRTQGARALIFDLRGNPGGYLYVAEEVASQFLSQGLILSERTRDGDEILHRVQPGGAATDLPLVILVDGMSASASEIVAGAVQDQERGLLIGETTFGKGSVQTTERLSDGSAVQLTIRRWYTPNGRAIQGEGLVPDIAVDRTAEDIAAGADPPLEAAIVSLREQLSL